MTKNQPRLVKRKHDTGSSKVVAQPQYLNPFLACHERLHGMTDENLLQRESQGAETDQLSLDFAHAHQAKGLEEQKRGSAPCQQRVALHPAKPAYLAMVLETGAAIARRTIVAVELPDLRRHGEHDIRQHLTLLTPELRNGVVASQVAILLLYEAEQDLVLMSQVEVQVVLLPGAVGSLATHAGRSIPEVKHQHERDVRYTRLQQE